jgi:hypothetical protein
MKISGVVVVSFDYGLALKIYKATEFIPDHISQTFAEVAGQVEAGWNHHVPAFINKTYIMRERSWRSFSIKENCGSALMKLANQHG